MNVQIVREKNGKMHYLLSYFPCWKRISIFKFSLTVTKLFFLSSMYILLVFDILNKSENGTHIYWLKNSSGHCLEIK